MNVSTTKLAVACGLALAAGAGQALAHGPAVVPDLQVFISGASAQQKTLGGVMSGICQAGTLDVYYDNATNGKDYRAYFCTIDGTKLGALGGKKVLVHNRAKGGSFQGVGPVARAQQIERMAINGACTSTGGTNPSYKCTGYVNAVPDAGVSDVEPALFTGPNVAVGDNALNSAELGRLTVNSQIAVMFGVAVTKNVAATNLTRSQVTSMLTGVYSDFSQIGQPAAPIYICRRAPGSGTQASFNAYFLANPCAASGALSPLAAADSANVTEGTSSGAVVACLNNHQAAGRKAIGILSLENQPTAADNYKFVNVDGIVPSELNATTGAYDLYVEQSFQYRNVTVAGTPAPSGNLKIFLDDFVIRAGDPGVLAGLTGVAALPLNYDPNSYAAGQVMKGTRLSNTCQPSQLFF
jgi:hypothetical protein